MFFVFNKSKICAYLVSLSTVAILFAMGFYLRDKNETMLTSSKNYMNKIENNLLNEIENRTINTFNK